MSNRRSSTPTVIDYTSPHHRPWLVIDAPHAAAPQADGFTGPIASETIAATGGHGLIALVSRQVADLNRPRNATNAWAMDAYRATLHSGLRAAGAVDDGGSLRYPVLHFCVHGMSDVRGHAIEIGTAPGWGREESASAAVRDAAVAHARDWWADSGFVSSPRDVVCNGELYGFSVLADHRWGDPDDCQAYPGYGAQYHCLQLEFSRTLREQAPEKVAAWMAALADHLQAVADGDARRAHG